MRHMRPRKHRDLNDVAIAVTLWIISLAGVVKFLTWAIPAR